MKPISLILVLAAFLFSCNNAGNDKKADGRDSAQNAGNTAPRTIVDGLEDLKTVLESKNPGNIASLMDFPLEDTIMNIYLDDSAFQKSYRAAGNKLSRSMFLKYYDTISRFTYLDKITEIFFYIPVDSMRTKDGWTSVIKGKENPCARSYSIFIRQDTVRLTYGTETNDEYVKKGTAQDDVRADAGCEYSVFWIFHFDGNKLRLIRQGAAG